jgi:hypothetical protein
MNFKEHYIVNEGILSNEYKICIFFAQDRFDNLKYGRPEEVWKGEIKSLKAQTVYSVGNILNNVPFDGKTGAHSDKRLDIKIDMDSLNNTKRVLTIYVTGVKINNTLDLSHQIYRSLTKNNDRITSVKIAPSHEILKQHLGKELKGKSKQEVEQTIDTLKRI